MKKWMRYGSVSLKDEQSWSVKVWILSWIAEWAIYGVLFGVEKNALADMLTLEKF